VKDFFPMVEKSIVFSEIFDNISGFSVMSYKFQNIE